MRQEEIKVDKVALNDCTRELKHASYFTLFKCNVKVSQVRILVII